MCFLKLTGVTELAGKSNMVAVTTVGQHDIVTIDKYKIIILDMLSLRFLST